MSLIEWGVYASVATSIVALVAVNGPWGVALVIAGLIFLHFLREKACEYTMNQDSTIFDESQKIMKEDFFRDFLECLLSSHAYHADSVKKIHEYTEYLEKSRHIDEDIKRAAEETSKAINQLLQWMSLNFFCFPENQSARLCMQPHWNADGPKKYAEATKKLESLAEEAERSYRAYRLLIKNKLFT